MIDAKLCRRLEHERLTNISFISARLSAKGERTLTNYFSIGYETQLLRN